MSDCKDKSTIEITKKLHELNITKLFLQRMIKNHEKEKYSNLVQKCTDILSQNSINDENTIYKMKQFIKVLFYLGGRDKSFLDIVSNITNNMNKSINIVSDITKLTEITVYEIIDSHKKEACDMIEITEKSLEEDYDLEIKNTITNSVRKITDNAITNILSNKKDHILQIIYDDINRNIQNIDKNYVSLLGSYIVSPNYNTKYPVKLQAFILVKTDENSIKSIHNLTNEEQQELIEIIDPLLQDDKDQLYKFNSLYNGAISFDEINANISELNAKINNKDKYTHEQLMKMMNEIHILENQKHSINLDLISNGYENKIDKLKEDITALYKSIYDRENLIYFKNEYLSNLQKDIIKGLKSDNDIIFLRTSLINISQKTDHDLHTSLVIIDKINKNIEYFEPHGNFDPLFNFSQVSTIINNILDEIFTDKVVDYENIIDSKLFKKILQNKEKYQNIFNPFHNMDGGEISKQEKDNLNKFLKNKTKKYNYYQNQFKQIISEFKKDPLLKHLSNLKIFNKNLVPFLEELNKLGKQNLILIKDQYLQNHKITIESKYIDTIKELIDNVYVLNMSIYNRINHSSLLSFEELGPQVLTGDSYCLAWSIFSSVLKVMNKDKNIQEIDTMMRSKKLFHNSTKSDLINEYKKTDFEMYLLNKYVILPPNKILNRIEMFILWLGEIISVVKHNDPLIYSDRKAMENIHYSLQNKIL